MKKYILSLISIALIIGCGGGSSSSGSSSGGSSANIGKGGSMARFAINGNYLYTLNKSEMEVFNISEPSTPHPQSKIHVPFDVETLFSYEKYLFVGGESGVYIYDNSVKTNPTKISEFTHAKSCDPVVVENNISFITLNKGSTCRLTDGENTLTILDVRDIEHPKVLKTLGMWDPKGLGIDNNDLFICDGDSGMKHFTITYESNESNFSISEATTKNDIDCYDVITNNKHLIVSNGDNVRQFDYTKFPMRELGKIK